jgi:nicotinamide-nucleotide amidase
VIPVTGRPYGLPPLARRRTRDTKVAKASRAEVAVSVTGIAGPDGGTAAKPVGLVHFACARRGAPTVAREERFGDIGRDAVRLASVRVGLDLLEAAGGL